VWREERIFGRAESNALDAEGDKCTKVCKVLTVAFLEFYARMQLVSVQQKYAEGPGWQAGLRYYHQVASSLANCRRNVVT
jgi:hypothetical protein